MLADELHHIVVALAADVGRHRVVRLEDVAAAFGRVQLGENQPIQFFSVPARPGDHVHVAAEGDAVAVLAAQFHHVQARLCLQRIVGVDPSLDEILKDPAHVAAAVVDHRQAEFMAGIHDCLHPRLEVLPPVGGRKESSLLVRHVAPDHHAVQHPAGGRDLCLRHLERKLVDPLDEAPHLIGIHGDPQHHVLGPDDAPQRFVALADTAVDGNIGMGGFHRLDPRGRVALERIADSGDLVVTGAKVAALVPGVLELERAHLLDGVRLEGEIGRHGQVEPLANHRAVAGAYRDLLLAFRQDLELADVRVHVRDRHHPVEVVVAVDIRVRCQAEFLTPAFQEAAPEEVAHRHAVRLLVPQRLVHPVELRQAPGRSCDGGGGGLHQDHSEEGDCISAG